MKVSEENAATVRALVALLRADGYQDHVVERCERELLAAADGLEADRSVELADVHCIVKLRANPPGIAERVKRVVRRRQ